MSFLSKIFSRKKKQEENLELKETPSYQQQPYPQQQIQSDDMEFKVLSSKIDALNIKLDMINQRLANLEKLAEQEPEEPEQKW